MVFGWLTRIFRRRNDEIYLIEAADFGQGQGNSAYDPSVAQIGDSINWVEADDNIWGVRVLDVRQVTHTMLLVAGEGNQFASNAVPWGASDGTTFIGEEPPVTRTVETNLRYPIDQPLVDGVLFIPDEMEHKWVLFYHLGRIIFVDSWQRQVRVVARVEMGDTYAEITEVHGTFFADDEDTEFTVRVLDFLLMSHALETDHPAPLPPGIAPDPRDAAEWCMFKFGNRASFATQHQIAYRDPENLPRTNSMLHIAAARGDEEAVEALLASGVPIDLTDRYGNAPLHWALEREGTAMMTLILEHGSPVDVHTSEGPTPLMIAAQHGSIDKVSFLLDRGANVNAYDERTGTALHFAAATGHVDVVRELLDRGGSPNIEARGYTPRSIAEEAGAAEILALLDEYNASAN